MNLFLNVKFSSIAFVILVMILITSPSLQAAAIPTTMKTEGVKTDLHIVDSPINFNQERIALTIKYRQLHQDPKANNVIIQPRMIILHWTSIKSLESSWRYFNNVRAESARPALAAAGEVNVSAHFLVDRDGTVYQLMPDNWMARHCIGLNHIAIGIENVGDGANLPLTDAQVRSNATLVSYLAAKYPITHLIAHREYRKMERHAYFLERDPKYRNRAVDPGAIFMRNVRRLVSDLKLQTPSDLKY
jgi:N-acetylmuramoyl-L-alanine amidase